MKTQKFISAAVFAAALFGTGALAQSAGQAGMSSAPGTPTPSQYVYLSQVPSPAELKARASSQGVTIDRIDQTQNQTIVVYKYPNGTTTTVGYSAIPAGDEAAAAGTYVPTPASPAPAVVAGAPYGTVVYGTAPAYAGYYDPYYYPWGWYPPVAIGLGFGWGWGGGFHGGFHGRGFHGGGFHGGGRHR